MSAALMKQSTFQEKHKLIVEQHVTNAGSDLGLLALTAGTEGVIANNDIYAIGPGTYYEVKENATPASLDVNSRCY